MYNSTGGTTTYHWDINSNEVTPLPTITTPWVNASMDLFKKRRSFLGRKDSKNEIKDAKIFFELLKKDLKVEMKDRFKELAEKAFDEALKAEKAGQKRVKKELEKRLELYLKKAAIEASQFIKIVDEKMINKYRKQLPQTKELVIDEVSEYEKPIPKRIQSKLTKVKKAKIFDSFWVFWIREVKDPILFGQINEESDVYYFIDEWARDIKIDDLLKHK